MLQQQLFKLPALFVTLLSFTCFLLGFNVISPCVSTHLHVEQRLSVSELTNRKHKLFARNTNNFPPRSPDVSLRLSVFSHCKVFPHSKLPSPVSTLSLSLSPCIRNPRSLVLLLGVLNKFTRTFQHRALICC
jgi:hypothetical protein